MVVKINNKSDFKINEWSESIALEVPFEFSYYIPLNKEKYVASFDGHKYINCTRLEDGSLDVIFNSHGLGIGRLKVVRKYHVDDSSFADGVFDVTSDDLTDVFLTSGKTFDTYVRTLVVPPYLKGDKGDPMTWNSMTDKERGELVEDIAEAIDPEMVMTENEKSRQAAEQSRQTAEQQRSTTFNTLKGEMQSAITAGNEAAGNAQKVVDEYDTKVDEQDAKLSELGSEISEFKKSITDQVNNYRPIEITGDVTNAADEEDLTSDEHNLLKLKNRNNLDGMGYIILRKNKTFAEQLTQTNTIYEVRYNFDLNGEEVTIPEGCVLDFQGGSLNNGVVVGNSTVIVAHLVKIFDSVFLGGSFLGSGHPEWYGTIVGEKSVCLIESMTSLYKGYSNIELQEGKYYVHSGKSIQCRSLEGKGRNTIIEVTGYTDDYTPFILGRLGGSPTERTWNQTIRGLRIEMRELDVLRTSCLSIGATTRCLIDNITCWNYAVRKSEFSATDLSNPENYCNYGIVVNGAIELTSMTNFVSSGDIGVYFKTSADVFTMLNGYIESNNFGFGGMYGYPIGTNSSISNVDISCGLYGFYFKTTGYDQGRFVIKNVRIEQLRKLYVNDNIVGCNVYIDATTGRLTPSYIENLGLSATTNGFYLKGDVYLSISKVQGNAGESQNEFDFKVEGNRASLDITEYKASINGGLDIPEGYALEGIESIQLNGLTYLKPKAGTSTRIYYPNDYVFDNRFTSINKHQYRRQYYKEIQKGYSNLVIFNTRVQRNIVLCKIIITIFDNDKYSYAVYILKFQQDENGNQTGALSDLKMVQYLGDEIMSDKYEQGKLCLTYDVGEPNVSMYNLLGKEVKSIVEFELYTKDII